jgi:hypothetical protein
MPEDKPEPKPEPKPVEKPSTSPEEQGNEGKARGRRFVKYQDLDKSELVSMLLRVNKRLTRVNKELREIINILYYGQAPQEGGGQNSGYRNYSYRRNYRKDYGRYGNRQYKRRGEDEEDVNYD